MQMPLQQMVPGTVHVGRHPMVQLGLLVALQPTTVAYE
jgi:hypothetical protein